VASVDDELLFSNDATTNISAGFVLGDGRTIAVWLPKPEAEINAFVSMAPPAPPAMPVAASAPTVPATPPTTSLPAVPPLELAGPGAFPSIAAPFPVPTQSDILVLKRDGRRVTARYIGIDGGSGLSLIRVDGNAIFADADDKGDVPVSEGQRIRLVSPVRVSPKVGDENQASTLYVKLGEWEGVISRVARGSAGKVSAISVVSRQLSPELVGGVVVDKSGRALGIIGSVKGAEAAVLPAAVVKSAAARVLARGARTPGPWLGIRGESVLGSTFGRLEGLGWSRTFADGVLNGRRGVLVTSIVPGAPAAMAQVRAGDIVVRVNGQDIVSNEDLSVLLNNARSGNPISLTLLRPNEPEPQSFTIKPGQVLDPVISTVIAERRAESTLERSPLSALGIEAFRISPRIASRLGATRGLLVLDVQPGSEAYRKGLRNDDVIESINEEPAEQVHVQTLHGAKETRLVIVRDRKRSSLVLASDSSVAP
jgi:S1-C subfamily serine protease